MQRYFINSNQLVDDKATITGEDVHHITTVMRAKVGDELLLVCDAQVTYLVAILTMSKTEVTVQIMAEKRENVELPIAVTIAHGITKGDKFDLVVQKGTECGAGTFLPVAMKRSVAKIDPAKAAKKVERWQKISLEAARQAHRQHVPAVMTPVDIKDLVAMTKDYDMCLFAYEGFDEASRKGLATAVNQLKPGARLLVLVGPEGGIDQTEVAHLTSAGFLSIGLGPRILRTETAPIYILSALSYALEVSR